MMRQQSTLLMTTLYGMVAIILLIISAFIWFRSIKRWGAAVSLGNMDERFWRVVTALRVARHNQPLFGWDLMRVRSCRDLSGQADQVSCGRQSVKSTSDDQ